MYRAIILCLLLFLATGCALSQHQADVVPHRSLLFEYYKAPLTTNFDHTKTERLVKVSSGQTHYFHDVFITGLDASWGDAAIPTIARKGGIEEVAYADYQYLNVLWIYSQFTVNVYGY